jgi:uncharacterized protein (TIGR03435 family)
VEGYQIVGGPAWTDTERYEVEARTEKPSTPAEMMLMLRTLLAERFQFQFHRENRTVTVNVLDISKSGPRFGPQLRQVKEDDPVPPRSRPVPDQLTFTRVSMKVFASYLRLNLTRDLPTGATIGIQDVLPLVDQTRLDGTYNIVLDTSSHDSWPNILERQHGLKLEERKVPTDVIVIDHVVRPGAN